MNKFLLILSLLLTSGTTHCFAASTVKLTPEMSISQPLENAESIEKYSKFIKPFLPRTIIMENKPQGDKPTVLAYDEGRLAGISGDNIYASDLTHPNAKNYIIVRPDKTYLDPKTKQVIGYGMAYIGKASLEQAGNPASLFIDEINLPIEIGDKLIAENELSLDLDIQSHLPSYSFSGEILSILGNYNEATKYNIVSINRGKLTDVQAGDVLTIYGKPRLITDPKDPKHKKLLALPTQAIGQLLIFRVYEQMSFGIIITAKRPLTVGTRVAYP